MTPEEDALGDGSDTTAEEPETPTDPETTADEPESLTEADAAAEESDRNTLLDRLAVRAAEKWRPILLVTLVIAAFALAIFVFFAQFRPDREIDDAAARRAVQAATDGAVAALSYSSDNIDRDVTNARSHLTGDFLAYYDKFTKEVVVPTVRQKNLTQTTTVVRAAISELHPDSAVVLAFVNETTTGKDKEKPLKTPNAVRITLTKIHGSWLISKLDPLV
jgi:Mce-associated membrane protein